MRHPQKYRPRGQRAYVVTLAVLSVAAAVAYGSTDAELVAYRAANERGARTLDHAEGREVAASGHDARLSVVAAELMALVQVYREAVDGTAEGIGDAAITSAAAGAGMTRVWAGAERTVRASGRAYQTLYRDLQFEACSLEQLLALLFNIESQNPRLRVEELSWALADRQDPGAPRHAILRPRLRVGLREALAREE